ncbi:17582_t:CDS:1, partial [Entrophospora sp. SA101]
ETRLENIENSKFDTNDDVYFFDYTWGNCFQPFKKRQGEGIAVFI